MSLYAPYILRQLFHYLNDLDLRLKIQLFLFLIILAFFFSEQSIKYLTLIAEQADKTPLGIIIFFEHLFFLPCALASPLIYHFLLPRQRSIHMLRMLPLKKGDVFSLLFGNYIKYQLLFVLPALPVFIAIWVVFNFLYALHFLLAVILFIILLFLLCFSLFRGNQSTPFVFGLNYLIITLYLLLISVFYFSSQWVSLAQIIFAIISSIVLWKQWQVRWEHWDIFLDRFQFYPHQNRSRSRKYWNIGRQVLPDVLNALFLKEIISYMRNTHYLRIKLLGYLIYALALLVMQPVLKDDYVAGSSLLTVLFIWLHYTHQFNEKYVLAESRFFIKTLSIKYHQLWSAKFLVELIFMLPILIIFIGALFTYGTPVLILLNMSLGAFVFAVFVLATIVTTRLLFYDNTRLAGYAYHFLVIFCLLMIGNFHLVGPLITLIILIYLGVLSYRQFSR